MPSSSVGVGVVMVSLLDTHRCCQCALSGCMVSWAKVVLWVTILLLPCRASQSRVN